MLRYLHFVFLIGLVAWPTLCVGQHPDASTGRDAVEHAAVKLTTSDGAWLETLDDPSFPGHAVVLPKVTYGEPSPGVSVQFDVPTHGYYTVSAWGWPERALWRAYDFADFHCAFGDQSYHVNDF